MGGGYAKEMLTAVNAASRFVPHPPFFGLADGAPLWRSWTKKAAGTVR